MQLLEQLQCCLTVRPCCLYLVLLFCTATLGKIYDDDDDDDDLLDISVTSDISPLIRASLACVARYKFTYVNFTLQYTCLLILHITVTYCRAQREETHSL